MVLAGKSLQRSVCLLLGMVCRAGLGALEEHASRTAESGTRLIAGQDLYRLVDAGQLLGAQARPLRPGISLVLAGCLRRLEEFLVSFQLRLGLVPLDARVRH